jgi:hypothetical protein
LPRIAADREKGHTSGIIFIARAGERPTDPNTNRQVWPIGYHLEFSS